MSLLPQRKKSSEEIAKLRESLGIPDLSPDERENPAAEIAPEPEPVAIEEIPPPEPAAVLSPRKSDGVTVLLPESAEPVMQPAGHAPKPVRSLRKSERIPSPATPRKSAVDPGNSKIPVHRHNDRDIEDIRRREALGALQSPTSPAVYFQSLLAHPALVIAGYLFAIAGAVCAFFDVALAGPIACEALALGIAAFICFKKTLSRHHAAFIFIIALLVVIFGALYYFPHLRNAP